MKSFLVESTAIRGDDSARWVPETVVSGAGETYSWPGSHHGETVSFESLRDSVLLRASGLMSE